MRRNLIFFALCAALAWGALGCGDSFDGVGGDGGDGDSGGDGGSAGRGGEAGTGGSAGVGGNGGTGPAATANVGGTVYEAGTLDMPVAGATVSIVGLSRTTTTSANGEFFFEDVPVGRWFLATSAAGNWGSALYQEVPAQGAFSLGLIVIPDSAIDDIAALLGETIDESKGIVGISFDGTESGSGGETATLSEAYDFAFVFNATGDPVLSTELLPNGLDELAFAGVDDTSELHVVPVGAEGVNECDLAMPGLPYPVLRKTIVEVRAKCELPP